jgi:ribosomal protein S18 acetylase RimI-like enzyme
MASRLFAEYRPDVVGEPRLTGLTTRAARFEDAVRLGELRHAREGKSARLFARAFKRLFKLEHQSVTVACLADRIVGYGRSGYFSPPSAAPANAAPEGWYLLGLLVDEAYRRRGVGHLLTECRLRELAACTSVAYYFANAQNQSTIRLHEQFGFVEHTRDFWYPRVGFHGGAGILFRLDLKASRVRT